MPSRVNYVVIHPRELVREELHSVLRNALGPASFSLGSLPELPGSGVLASVDLIVAGFEDHSEAAPRWIRELRFNHPALRLLIVASVYDPDHLMSAIQAGADGYLLTDASRELMVATVGCLLRGGYVLPVQFRELIGRSESGLQSAPEFSAASRSNGHDLLSKRESEVARHLARSATNKMIARELGLSDATVKVHVRSILRKLRLQNRQQVGVWAQQHLPSGAAGGRPWYGAE